MDKGLIVHSFIIHHHQLLEFRTGHAVAIRVDIFNFLYYTSSSSSLTF
jgi:hypothetical protein